MRFSDFVTLQRGFDLTKTEMRDGPYPVIGSTSIIGRHDEFKVKPPGVTTGRSGSLGVVQFVSENYWPHNTSLWVKDFKGNDPKFVYYCMQGLDFARFNAGAGVPTLNRNHLGSLEVEVPALDVQIRIAGILSAYDELIENSQRRIKILEAMARSLYREWFVHFRVPGHDQPAAPVGTAEGGPEGVSVRQVANQNHPRVASALGEIPQGWEVKRVTDAIYVNPRVVVSREGEKPFVPMSCLSNDSMLITDVESRTGNSGTKFQNGDTLFARITPCLENGKTGYVQFLPDSAAVAFGSTEYIVLRSHTLTPEFVYCMSRSDEFRGIAIKSMSGATGRQRVQEKCFDDFLIAQAPKSLLDQFAAIVRLKFLL